MISPGGCNFQMGGLAYNRSGQWERTGLGRICDVEIRYQVGGMGEFQYRNPF